MSSIVSIDTRGYDISMGPGMLRVGGGGGLAGNVYINGNVGIGVINPTARLDVSGSMIASGTIIAGLYFTNGSFISESSTANTGHIRVSSSGSANYIQSGLTAASGSSAPLYFTNIFAANVWMTITANGRVGIGITAPTTTLDVSGVIKTSGGVAIGSGSEFQIEKSATSKTLLISHYSNPNTPICFYNYFPGGTTRVGIDTTSPAATLDVNGTITSAGLITADGGIRYGNSPMVAYQFTGTASQTIVHADLVNNVVKFPTADTRNGNLTGITYVPATGVFTNSNAYAVTLTVNVNVSISNNMTGFRVLWLTTSVQGRIALTTFNPVVTDPTSMGLSCTFVLNSSETFNIRVYQTSGVDLTIAGAAGTFPTRVSLLVM